jgi:hypothetical protein
MAFKRLLSPSDNFACSQYTGTVDDDDFRIHILIFQLESKG